VKIGITFPQTEIGHDPAVLRDFAQTAEGLGFTHILAYDHVLGADPSDRPEGWRRGYTHESSFHEPLVLFAYLGAVTTKIEFVSGIIILPQRQAALVAKQAAEVDILTGERLRLGVAIGWNPAEYQALGEDFHTRGRRIAEQIDVMRLLWTKPVVDYTGRWHRIERAGIKPLPSRSIPVWMGGMSDAVIKRTAQIADGWFPQFADVHAPAAQEAIDKLQGHIRDAGRKPEDVGIEGRVSINAGTPDEWGKAIERWHQLGANWMQINTMGAGLDTPQAHIERMKTLKTELGI
jgi:probable F420-dependent oxidoreductase